LRGPNFSGKAHEAEGNWVKESVKVLLIDANVADTIELRQKLVESKNVSFTTRTAATLSEGLAMFEGERFDVALVDSQAIQELSMPRLTTLHAIAAETPLIVLSTTFEESRALEAVRAGAQDYVVKSRLNAAALERLVLYGIERHLTQRQTALQFSVSRVLAASGSMADAGVNLLRVLCEFTHFDLGQLWQKSLRLDELVCAQSWHVAGADFSKFVAASRDLRFQRGEGLPGRVWDSGTPIWITDATVDPNFFNTRMALQDGLRAAFAFPIRMGDETLGVMEFVAREARDPDTGIFKVAEDIAQQIGQFMARRLAEEEKENLTNERLMILDSASEGIYGVDLKGCITFLNRSAAKMFGCTPSDVLGKNSHELFHHTRADGSSYPAGECPLTQVLSMGVESRIPEDQFWRLDGSGFLVDYSTHPLSAGGKITGAVVCFNDITDRKRMEIELRHAQKLESVGALAAGIAHEINTPIQFIGDNTRFLQDAFRDTIHFVEASEVVFAEASKGSIRSETLEAVKRIRKQADWDYLRTEVPKAMQQMLDGIGRVAKIVRAMKEFSHVDRSSEKAPADINKALESTLIVARNELKYVADVETHLGELPPVLCHLGDLNQVFLNLLVNAAHAIGEHNSKTDEKGKIGVRTRSDGECVEIAISDSGAGIPEVIRNKIFDPFFTTKEVGKGSGQGLALARAIVVEKHGGTLTFQTEVGKGTTFFVRLPLSEIAETREAVAK
jgi:PAS domain S-box-containing protein